MSRIVGSDKTIELMVNCKTYPAVSTKYIETVCTGGISRAGDFIRLYPIPFRLLDEKQQYDRWDVIRVKVYRDTKDTRPESHHLASGGQIEIIDTVKNDRQKWDWMRKGVYLSCDDMKKQGRTNGLVEITPHELYWEPEAKKWSAGQLSVFEQGNLFHGQELMKSLADRVPWQFKLKLTEKNTGREFDQKVLAWSYYQGYRRQLDRVGDEQAALTAVRDRVYASIKNPEKCVYAIFGTHSRFGHWMISGLYHVPRAIRDKEQDSLF